MPLVRILVDGYSLLHNWPEIAPGKPRFSATAREELISRLTRYYDACQTPLTIVFDGHSGGVGAGGVRSTPEVEVLFTQSGQTADQLIERAAHRLSAFGEVLAVTDDFAERDTVISLGGQASSCDNFIQTVEQELAGLERDEKTTTSGSANAFTARLDDMKDRLLFLLALGCLAAPAGVAQTSTNATHQGQRYLFIVDTSASMKRMEAAVRATLHDLIFTGFDGRWQAGDTFGLWTFNEKTYADFPMQVWTPEQSWNSSRDTATFLRAQRYEKESRTDQLLKRLFSVINSVKDVTVILVTDGSALLQGTPYDEPINRVYHQELQGNRRPAKPFITLLVARHGVIDTWQVHPPGERITLPLLPEPETVAPASPPPATQVAATPAPSPSSKPIDQQPKAAVADRSPTPPANSPAKALPVKPSSEPAPIKSEEAKPVRNPPAEVAKPKPVMEAKVTNAVPVTPVSQPEVKTSTPPAEAVSPALIKNPEVTPVPVTPRNAVDAVASKTNAPEAAAPNLATAVLPENQFSPAGLLIIGAVLLVLACGLGWLLLRRRHAPQPSLISQSMNQKPK